MNDLDMMLGLVAAAQQRAAVSLLLPVLFSDPTSKEMVGEWMMFSPIADQYATQVAPNTAYTNPTQFLNWVFSHNDGSVPGVKDYAKHIVNRANAKMNKDATDILDSTTLRIAQQSLNKYGMLIPGQHFKEDLEQLMP